MARALPVVITIVGFLTSAFHSPGNAADWSMFRGDAGRGGYTAEALPAKLSLLWKHTPKHAPVPAWKRDERMSFDRTFRPIIAGGLVVFGSSADDQVRALDIKTGELKWKYFTDGPIRFAPVAYKTNVYVVSDDGHLYCLNLPDGKLRWKKFGGPSRGAQPAGFEKTAKAGRLHPAGLVLGNARIISRWPARGGPVIFDGVLYFAAGIWQSEQVFIHAVDPESGKSIWTNDSSGGINMPQPHGGAYAKSGVTVQGHLVADAKHLYVPTGRAVPAVFDRKTGKILFYHLQANGRRGGTSTTVIDRFIYNGGYAYTTEKGTMRTRLGNGPVARFAGGILHHNGSRLQAVQQVRKKTKDRRGKEIVVDDHKSLWRLDNVPGGTSLIVAGNVAISGGEKAIAIIDLKERKIVQRLAVDGTAYGLAVGDGRLIVSTDRGTQYCFGSVDQRAKATTQQPVPKEDLEYSYFLAAKKVIAKSSITEGYCVDLGCRYGALSLVLAQHTKLRIIAIESDPKKVAAARKMFVRRGLYGTRVTVHLADLEKTRLPKFFANLVVSGRTVSGGLHGLTPSARQEAKRLQRPWGGVVCLGKADEMKADVRGPLKNAGDWSHLYSNPANTAASKDDIKGPLSVLWYRDVDLELPQRHGRGPAPLFHRGRLFAEGLDELRGVDAYNGRTLWSFKLPGILHAYNADHIVGTSQTGTNFCANGDSVYVRKDNICYRLNAASGKVIRKFTTPFPPLPRGGQGGAKKSPPSTRGGQGGSEKKPGRWGYIAVESGILFGSIVDENHIVRHAWRPANKQMQQLYTESPTLFAMDVSTGKLLWRYDAKHSIRHNAIAIGDGRVFLIDRPLAEMDRLDRVAKRRGKKAAKTKAAKHATGTLVVLDAKTGKQKWDNKKDIFGTVLAFSKRYDMLMMCYSATRFRLPSEVGGRMAVFRATEGYRVWDKKVKYVTRPLVNGRTIYAQGGAWDLLTGDEQPFKFKRAYGCGQISASKNLLLFRSGTLGYYDLSRKAGTESFGGIRPGCWINALPAGGLVFIPDASAGCSCSYQNRAWVALQGQ